MRLAVALLGLWAAPALAGGLPVVTVGSPRVEFAATSPLERQRVSAKATSLRIESGARWTLKARLAAPLGVEGGPRLPHATVEAAIAGSAERALLGTQDVVLLADQPPTPEGGRLLWLDFALSLPWSNGVLDHSERYSSALIYTVEAEDAPASIDRPVAAIAAVAPAPASAHAQPLLTLGSARPAASAGDLVPLELTLRAAEVELTDATAWLDLGPGLALVPGSIERDGAALAPGEGGEIRLGRLAPGAAARVRLIVGVRPGGGWSATARAQASAAGLVVEAAPAALSLRGLDGELSGLGGAYGRVCFDLDGDGSCSAAEPPARDAVVFADDGSVAQADARGRYHLPALGVGRRSLYAGPGPLRLGPRGGLPRLPRSGGAAALAVIPAGHFAVVDLALPPPPGFEVDPSAWDEAVASTDEGDVLPERRHRSPLEPLVPAQDEGDLDAAGMMVGIELKKRGAPSAAQLSPLEGPEEDAEATEGAPPSSEPRPEAPFAAVASGEAVVGLDLLGGSTRPELGGRLSLVAQQDLGREGFLSLVVDSGRDPAAAVANLDPRFGYAEYGDQGLLRAAPADRAFLELQLPSVLARAGRLSSTVQLTELAYLQRHYLGADVLLGSEALGLRVFGGVAGEPTREETFAGEGRTGPFQLAAAPIAAGSEAVELEVRTEAGDLLERARLVSGIDYFLDLTNGTLQLARPLPAAIPGGHRSQLVVRYSALGAGLEAGRFAVARAQAAGRRHRLGLGGFWEERGAGSVAALTADASLEAGPLGLELALAAPPDAVGDPLGAGAARGRATLALGSGVRLFALGAHTGEGWVGEVRSRPFSPPLQNPFGLLDPAGNPQALLPVLAQALGREGDFPIAASDALGTRELGGGVDASWGPLRGIALARRRQWEGGGADLAELAVRGALGEGAAVYAAHQVTAAPGELDGPAAGPRSRHTVLGGYGRVGRLLAAQLDLRQLEADGAGLPASTREVALRAGLLTPVRPSVFASYAWLRSGDQEGALARAGVGIEAEAAPGLRAFAYVHGAHAAGGLASAQSGAFAAVEWQLGGGDRLLLRYDLGAAQGRPVHGLAWDVRRRVLRSLVLQSDGTAGIGRPDRLVRVSAAWTPEGPLRALVRALDEVGATPAAPRTQLASADLGLRLGPGFELGGKALIKRQELEAVSQTSALFSGAARLELGGRLDAGLAARVVRAPQALLPGATAELGYSVAGLLRLSVGANFGARAAFAIDQRTPGVFVAIGGTHGGVLGAPVPAPLPAAEEPPPAMDEAEQAVASSEPSPPPPAAAPSTRAPRSIAGRLYADRNASRSWDKDEPVFEGVVVRAGRATAKTNADGTFTLVAGPEAQLLEVAEGPPLPVGYAPTPVAIGGAPSAEVALAAHRPTLVRAGGRVQVVSPAGAVGGSEEAMASFPMAAWVAGLPLSVAESRQLEGLAARALGQPSLRLLVVAHAQTGVPLKAAVKRATRAANAVKRYFQGAQLVPGKRITVAVIEAEANAVNALGTIDVYLIDPTANPTR